MKRLIRLMVGLAIWIQSAVFASAQVLLAYEGFNYSTGLSNSSNSGTGWNGGWYLNSDLTGTPTAAVYAAGSMIFPNGVNFQSSGNRIGTTTSYPNNVGFRQLSALSSINLGSDATYYLSFIYDSSDTSQWGGLSFWDASGNEQMFFGVMNSKFFLAGGLLNSSSVGSAPSFTQHFITAKIVARAGGFDEIYMQPYLNSQTVANTDPSTWLYSKTDISSSAVLDRVRIAAGAPYEIDEIRLGTSWQTAVVPEPSALSLLAVGLGVVLRRRRRTV